MTFQYKDSPVHEAQLPPIRDPNERSIARVQVIIKKYLIIFVNYVLGQIPLHLMVG